MKQKIILDCDPGIDDAIAILLAHGDPSIDLLAITTVVGNQTLAKVTHNALAIAQIANIVGVPIAAGCQRPLVRPLEHAAEIHGESGLGHVTLPESQIKLDARHAVDLIIDMVMQQPPKTITLVPIGGLTNIALAVRKAPQIVERVKEVVLMGGGYHRGNRTAVAEFNIKIDPEAAHIVFNEPWLVTMVGLDLTEQALATPEVIAAISAIGTPVALFAAELLTFISEAHHQTTRFVYPPIHDPCAVARVIDRQIVKVKKAPVHIELQGALTTGMTVTDFRQPAPEQCHTQVATQLDNEKFWQLIINAIKRI